MGRRAAQRQMGTIREFLTLRRSTLRRALADHPGVDDAGDSRGAALAERSNDGAASAAVRGRYNRAFAPYVVPGAVPRRLDSLPDARWAAGVVTSQLRGFLRATLS